MDNSLVYSGKCRRGLDSARQVCSPSGFAFFNFAGSMATTRTIWANLISRSLGVHPQAVPSDDSCDAVVSTERSMFASKASCHHSATVVCTVQQHQILPAELSQFSFVSVRKSCSSQKQSIRKFFLNSIQINKMSPGTDRSTRRDAVCCNHVK